ncbi:MAG: hypothetical protein ACLU5J_03965 [Christensenellales bacterium]
MNFINQRSLFGGLMMIKVDALNTIGPLTKYHAIVRFNFGCST